MIIDELSSLVAGSIEAAAAEPAVSFIPKADFTASLDFIDSLASRRAFALSRRDLYKITTAVSLFDYLPLTSSKAVPDLSFDKINTVSSDLRPLQDRRLFDPEGQSRRLAGFSRSSSEVVTAPEPIFPAWRPKDPLSPPGRWRRDYEDELERSNRIYWQVFKKPHPFAFREPDRVAICLRRRIRRNIMHAFGFAGRHYFPRHVSKWSWVVC